MNTYLPRPGAVILIKRSDHYLGTEDLVMRVKQIGDGKHVPDALEWVTVEGTALNHDGSDRGFRSALVRMESLHMQRQIGQS